MTVLFKLKFHSVSPQHYWFTAKDRYLVSVNRETGAAECDCRHGHFKKVGERKRDDCKHAKKALELVRKVLNVNKKDRMIKRNESMRLLSLRMRGKRNAVYIGDNEGRAHALKKAEICHRLKQLDREFYTEAMFKNNKRADVFVLDDCLAIEVIDSEGMDSIKEKAKEYPCRVVSVGVDEEFVEEMLC